MSEGTGLPRPRQVTMAGWLAIVASVLLVVTVFESITGLRDLETRETVERFLSEPPGDGLGLSVQGALSLLQVVSMVAAGCAAAAVVLGFHVLKRSRSARLGLTVLAVPIFVSGMVAGGLLSWLVAAAAMMLWMEPARDWFDGRPPRPVDREESERPSPWRATPPPSVSGPPRDPKQPRPHEGFGRPPASVGPVVGGTPDASWPPPSPPAPSRRPGAVLWACIVTWVSAGLAALLMGLTALVLATSPELVMEELRRQDPDVVQQGVTQGALRTATFTVAGVTLVWSAVAAVLAVLVLRRRAWARVALLGCAAAAGATSLVGSFASVPLLLPAAACGVTLSLLLRRDVRRWCSRT